MQFRLRGNKVDDVSAASGTWEYRKAARNAVRRLDCIDTASTSTSTSASTSASNQAQQFSFLIGFNQPVGERAGRSSSVALLER